MVETSLSDGFWDPERCRDDVPAPLPVPSWDYIPPMLAKTVDQNSVWPWYCVHCKFFFFAGQQKEFDGWPLCDVCGITFNLIATGHLPFPAQTEEEPLCGFCFQSAGKLEKGACVNCNFLVGKTLAGDKYCGGLLKYGCDCQHRPLDYMQRAPRCVDLTRADGNNSE